MFHRGQKEIMEHPARFKLVTCGRRWGKTLLGKNAILYQALRYQNAAGGWRPPTKWQAKPGAT